MIAKKLYRSLLFSPGSNLRAMQKTLSLNCDVAIFDLEDAVGVKHKSTARENVNNFLRNIEKDSLNMKIVVRVNGLDTEWLEDDIASVCDLCDNILIPKVSNEAMVNELDALLTNKYKCNTPLWCMIETPHGVHNSYEIVRHQRVNALMFGSNDLSKDLKARQTPSREPLLYGMSRCINAARMENKLVFDGVHGDIKNLDEFKATCSQGRDLGFDGKSLIHPSQIAPCNNIYSPSPSEMEWYRKIVHHWDTTAHDGILTVDKKMVEKLHVDEAREFLELYSDRN